MTSRGLVLCGHAVRWGLTEHLDGKAVEIADDLERWECLFFPVYPIDEGLDQPTEWAFIGVSGD